MTTGTYIITALAIVLPWAGTVLVSVHYMRVSKRLLQTNDDLTAQLVALKNPYAAQLFAQSQVAREHSPGPRYAGDADEGAEEILQ